MANLFKMFVATDATQIEVNPLAETPDGKSTFVVCVDAVAVAAVAVT
jgi:succinyl-CoA synthetase beta subunit